MFPGEVRFHEAAYLRMRAAVSRRVGNPAGKAGSASLREVEQLYFFFFVCVGRQKADRWVIFMDVEATTRVQGYLVTNQQSGDYCK